MSGIVVDLVPKRVFSFDTLSVGQSQAITVLERIDVSQFTDGTVVLRVHTASASGGTITFDLLAEGETDDDPALSFLGASPFFTAPPIDSTFNATTPTMRAYGGTVRGHYATLRVTGSRTGASALNATVSVALSLRSPDSSM